MLITYLQKAYLFQGLSSSELELVARHARERIVASDGFVYHKGEEGTDFFVIAEGKVQLLTRNHLDWTHRYSPVADALQQLDVESAILDGEVVVQFASGVTSFQALQNALQNKTSDLLVYSVFDLLESPRS